MSKELVERLRIISNMINAGEKIGWGEETALMDEAADLIERQRELMTKAHAVMRDCGWQLAIGAELLSQ